LFEKKTNEKPSSTALCRVQKKNDMIGMSEEESEASGGDSRFVEMASRKYQR